MSAHSQKNALSDHSCSNWEFKGSVLKSQAFFSIKIKIGSE